MKDFELQQLAESIDLVEVVRSKVSLTKSLNGSCPKCGGHDRFYILKSHRHFGCRQCSFKGDVIDFVAGAFNLSLPEAISFLTNGAERQQLKPTKTVVKQPNANTNWRTGIWQKVVGNKISKYERNLVNDNYKIGLEYLHSRGIPDETAIQFKLGYVPDLFDPIDKSSRPAIAIPWVLYDGTVLGVKYRYIDLLGSTEHNRRYRQESGGELILFGLHTLQQKENLVLIEGEFNCIAIQQCSNGFTDAISIGADSNTVGIQQAIKISKNYKNMFVWMDDPSKAEKVGKIFGHMGHKAMVCHVRLGKLGTYLADAADVLARCGDDKLKVLVKAKLIESQYS